MSATFAELSELYDRWRQLSQLETEAICLEAWNRLTKCHSAKAELQASISQASRRWKSELSVNRDRLRQEQSQIQALILELLDLEKKNEELLSRGMARIEEQRGKLRQSSRNVSQLHRSYSLKSEPRWISYS